MLIYYTLFRTGQTAYGALTEWYQSDGAEGSYIDDIVRSPTCNPSCCSKHCHKCRNLNEISEDSTRINLVHLHRNKNEKIIENNRVEEIQGQKNKNDRQRIVYYSSGWHSKPNTVLSTCILLWSIAFLVSMIPGVFSAQW